MSSHETLLALPGNNGAETACKAVSPLQTIYFYLTEGCNLRCRHCWIEPPHQTEKKQYRTLEPDLFRHILQQAKPLGLSSVKLTGGEPLMHPRIGEILESIRRENLGLTVETNGTLCTTSLARDLARCGAKHVSVSLDGADAQTHEWVRGVRGCFDAAVSGIRNLVAAGIRPQVIMSLMRRNVDQIEAVVRLAESLGASSVKFNIVQPTARGVKMHQVGETLPLDELLQLGARVENELSRRSALRLYYSHPVAFRPLGNMFGDGCNCGICSIHRIIGVLAGGSYALCGIGETIPDLVFGHASKDHLAEVWKDNPVLREIREGLPRRLGGICGECLMKGVCRGNCIAQNYYRSRNLWAPFWYCEEASRMGLFPPSRVKKSLPVRHETAAIPCRRKKENPRERAHEI